MSRAELAQLARARADQWARRNEPHVAELVAFADQLATARGLPAGAVPTQPGRGRGARPGAVPAQRPRQRSEERHGRVRDAEHAEHGPDVHPPAGGRPSDWAEPGDGPALERNPLASDGQAAQPRDVREGARALLKLLELLPDLRGVVMLGGCARDVWRRRAT